MIEKNIDWIGSETITVVQGGKTVIQTRTLTSSIIDPIDPADTSLRGQLNAMKIAMASQSPRAPAAMENTAADGVTPLKEAASQLDQQMADTLANVLQKAGCGEGCSNLAMDRVEVPDAPQTMGSSEKKPCSSIDPLTVNSRSFAVSLMQLSHSGAGLIPLVAFTQG